MNYSEIQSSLRFAASIASQETSRFFLYLQSYHLLFPAAVCDFEQKKDIYQVFPLVSSVYSFTPVMVLGIIRFFRESKHKSTLGGIIVLVLSIKSLPKP